MSGSVPLPAGGTFHVAAAAQQQQQQQEQQQPPPQQQRLPSVTAPTSRMAPQPQQQPPQAAAATAAAPTQAQAQAAALAAAQQQQQGSLPSGMGLYPQLLNPGLASGTVAAAAYGSGAPPSAAVAVPGGGGGAAHAAAMPREYHVSASGHVAPAGDGPEAAALMAGMGGMALVPDLYSAATAAAGQMPHGVPHGALGINGPVMASLIGDPSGMGLSADAAAGLPLDRRVTLHFSIPYPTKWGQSLLLCGSGALLGNLQWSRGRPLACHHDKDTLVWEVTVVVPWKPFYTYKYAVVHHKEEDGSPPAGSVHGQWVVEKEEAAHERTVWLPEGLQGGDLVEICDTWVDRSHPAALMASAAFTQVLFVHRPVIHRDGLPQSERRSVVQGETVIRLQVADYQLEAGQAIYVTGGIPQLGNWQADQMLQLTETHTPYWAAEIRVPYAGFSFTYKYAIRTEEGLMLEVGEPRLAALPPSSTAVGVPSVMVRHDGFFRRDRYWRGAGVAVPVFSLRTLNSIGVGDFYDLLPLIDLSARCGMRLIQVLPVNDTCVYGNWWDSYPYSTLSVHALHPQYMALRALLDPDMLEPEDGGAGSSGALDQQHHYNYGHHGHHHHHHAANGTEDAEEEEEDGNGNGGFSRSAAAAAAADGPAVELPKEWPQDLRDELVRAQEDLEGPEVDYEAMMRFKTAFVKKVYERYGGATTRSHAYKAWLAANASWLKPYAAFVLLRDVFQTAEHWRWGCLAGPGAPHSSAVPGAPHNETVAQVVARVTDPHGPWWARIELTYFTQYHLHRQLKKVADYARAQRVVLKGDLPIGVDKRSVDTWTAPHLFRMDKSTGAPPDAFSPTGQNWGFPTYNWQAMAAEGFAWWRSRLTHMARYFSALRVDHILGFFRIWEVPGDCVTGMLGYFRPSKPLTRSELEQRGLWDVQRLTQPYITQPLLRETFGPERADDVGARYMVEAEGGRFKLRPKYSTEVAISAIPIRPGSPDWLEAEVKADIKGLLALRQNVVLVPDPEDPDAFHPRFNLMATSSYAALPPQLRAALRHMHDDYYYRRQEDTWRASALSKLPALQAATDMLMCGEDLGFVPACVPPVMKELGLIGLRIQRMSIEEGREFNNPAAYPYLTVASPSCHDITPLRAWYEGDAERSERFFCSVLGGCGDPPSECSPDVARAVLQQHINCPSILAIFPMQDLLALSPLYSRRPAAEEVINDPTVAKHYWRYRVHVPLEQLLSDTEWCCTVAEMLILGERAGQGYSGMVL